MEKPGCARQRFSLTWESGIAVLSNVMIAALPSFPGAYVAPVALLAWIGLAAALCASWPQLRKELFPPGEPGWVLPTLAVMTVAGLGVRFLFCHGLPMVNSYGGLTRVVDAYAVASFDWNAQFQSIYPLGVTSLAGAIMVVAGKTAGVYFSLVSLLSALLVPAIYLAARLLWGRPREALIAAAMAAIYPPMLTFSGSACLTVPYATLATLSIALLLLWLRTASLATFCAFGFALLLTLQTRPEAVIFVVPVLAAPLLNRRLSPRELLTPAVLSAAALLFLFALPFLVTQYGHYLASSSSGQGEPGWQAAIKWFLRGGLAAAFLYWWGSKQEKKGQTPRFTAAGVLILLLLLILEYHHGLHVLAGGGYPFRGFTQTDTYAPIEIVFFNPKLTPLALILAYITAVALLPSKSERRKWLFLHLWLVPLFAAGFLKRGGEVPFFGVRTTLSAAPAFLLVSARGVSAVVDQFSGKAVAGLALAALLTCVFPFFAGLDRTYNQQQQFLHLQTALAGVPDRSVVLYPADSAEVTVEGSKDKRMVDFSRCFRTRTLFAALLGDNERGIEYLPVAPDGAMPQLPDDRPAYFYQGLLCYRTGSSKLTPACRRALNELPLAAKKGRTIPNRMYVADFFEDLRIVGNDVTIFLHEL